MVSREGLCIQIETSALLEANKIACALESVYVGSGPLNVIRGDTDEGHALMRFFPEVVESRELIESRNLEPPLRGSATIPTFRLERP